MTNATPGYPFILERAEIEDLLPHRGDIFVCQRLVVEGPHQFKGVARWSDENAIIQSHFPEIHIVPGVMLIEAMAQLAGAGLRAGDPYVRAMTGDLIGVLTSVRKCVFRHPVLPLHDVEYDIHCRRMAPMAVQIGAKVCVRQIEVAQLDILMVYAQKQQLLSALGNFESGESMSSVKLPNKAKTNT